jgi:hypothetical protein
LFLDCHRPAIVVDMFSVMLTSSVMDLVLGFSVLTFFLGNQSLLRVYHGAPLILEVFSS